MCVFLNQLKNLYIFPNNLAHTPWLFCVQDGIYAQLTWNIYNDIFFLFVLSSLYTILSVFLQKHFCKYTAGINTKKNWNIYHDNFYNCPSWYIFPNNCIYIPSYCLKWISYKKIAEPAHMPQQPGINILIIYAQETCLIYHRIFIWLVDCCFLSNSKILIFDIGVHITFLKVITSTSYIKNQIKHQLIFFSDMKHLHNTLFAQNLKNALMTELIE